MIDCEIKMQQLTIQVTSLMSFQKYIDRLNKRFSMDIMDIMGLVSCIVKSENVEAVGRTYYIYSNSGTFTQLTVFTLNERTT